MSVSSEQFPVDSRVWHRSDAAGAAGTVISHERIGGVSCAVVRWDDLTEPTATPLTALVRERGPLDFLVPSIELRHIPPVPLSKREKSS